jgi:hypothetical protein
LDLFAKELRSKRERLRQTLMAAEVTEVDRCLREAFQKEWRDLSPPVRREFRVVAVDSGRAHQEYALGAVLYVCRAVAVSSWGKSYRAVVSDSHVIVSPREQLSNLVSLRSEHVEHQVALEALKDAKDVDAVLLDGSLYGRVLHVPVCFDYPGETALYLKYVETLSQLFEECRRRKILLLGVSKDSLAAHLTRLLLNDVTKRILEALSHHLSPEHMTLLRQNLADQRQESSQAMRLVADLPLTENQRETLRSLVTEIRHPRPDFALIFPWAKTAGYTTPIEPYPDVPFYKYRAKDLHAYVQRRFDDALADYHGREQEFETWAYDVLQKPFRFPAIVTFCVKLAHNDTPLRVDVPAYNVGLPTTLSELSESQRLDPPPVRVEDILRFLRTGYGGPDLYNVWLVRADQEARLPESDFTTLYEPLVEKELKLPLVPTRRNRRARYAR